MEELGGPVLRVCNKVDDSNTERECRLKRGFVKTDEVLVTAIRCCTFVHWRAVAVAAKSNLYGYLAARWARCPVFATCHLWFSATIRHRMYSGLDRLVLRHFDGVIGVSPPIGKTLHKSWVPERRVAVIANGVDVSPFLSVEDASSAREFCSNLTIGIIGRLVPQKGHPVLFAAARRILEKFSAAKFVVVGDGPDRKQLEGLVQELGIAGSVYFAGFRDDMARVYAGLDLIVMIAPLFLFYPVFKYPGR